MFESDESYKQSDAYKLGRADFDAGKDHINPYPNEYTTENTKFCDWELGFIEAGNDEFYARFPNPNPYSPGGPTIADLQNSVFIQKLKVWAEKEYPGITMEEIIGAAEDSVATCDPVTHSPTELAKTLVDRLCNGEGDEGVTTREWEEWCRLCGYSSYL